LGGVYKDVVDQQIPAGKDMTGPAGVILPGGFKCVTSVNKDERKRIYKQAQKIIVETDLPVLPVYSMVEHLLISKRVKNYPMNPMSNFIWKDVELVK